MSQRTRGRTTGAATHNQPEPGAAAGLLPARRRKTRPAAVGALSPLPAHGEGGGRGSSTAADAGHPLDPEAIARTLRAVADALERDPALARRVAAGAGSTARTEAAPADAALPAPAVHRRDPGPTDRPAERGARKSGSRAFQPRLVVGTPPALGPGIPDPFALRERLGPAGLQATLADLRLGTLRAIVREHRLDPSGRLARQNDAERLRTLILEATAPQG